MVSTIFEAWIRRVDARMQIEGRKIVMLVDNCPAHPKVNNLKAIQLEFFPPKATSVLQPLNQGIIKNF